MDPFTFTPAQIDAIRAPLLKHGFARLDIAHFIEWAGYSVAAWQAAWPLVDAAKGKADLARLKKISRLATDLHYEMNTLDNAWLQPVAARLNLPDELSGRSGAHRLSNLISDLRGALDRELLDYSEEYGHNGRGNARKADLASRLAWDFSNAFDSAPTTTLSGPFMAAMAAIADAVGEPIGKATLASAVRGWRNQHKILYNPQDL